MISVILATHNDEMLLAYALSALVPAAAEGIVREVIVADANSSDGTVEVADAAGCHIVSGTGRVGADLAAAAAIAKSEWLLFLTPRAMLEPGWQSEVREFMERLAMSGQGASRAAVFRHARASFGLRPRLAEIAASLRAHLFAIPYPEEGLLVPAQLYREVGGHRPLAGVAEVDLVRRIGRSRLSFLRARAVLRGDAEAKRRSRPFRDAACLALVMMRVPSGVVSRLAA